MQPRYTVKQGQYLAFIFSPLRVLLDKRVPRAVGKELPGYGVKKVAEAGFPRQPTCGNLKERRASVS